MALQPARAGAGGVKQRAEEGRGKRTERGKRLLRGRALARDLDEFRFDALTSLHPLALNATRQFFLAPQLHDRVLFCDFGIGMAGDLGSLDAAAANLLAPGDVGPPQRMRTKAKEVAALGCG